MQGLVRERSAIVLDAGKEYLAESRLAPVARGLGLSTLGELVSRLRSEPRGSLSSRVVEAMTTNETSFFRDLNPFDALRTTILPQLIQARAKERTLNLWCAASSSGQEPYTIAMVLREHFPQLLEWRVRFIATDISTEMLRRCREGIYSQLEINRGLPARYLVKYFEKRGTEWQIHKPLRDMVEFVELNLAGHWPALPQCDVVFIRNVLIYFNLETKRDIVGRVRKLLRPDGCMFLGGAETTLNVDEGFRREAADKTFVYRLAR
ncbi:MAG: protein-glutamate O-methyltransferase CheR [Planctomycetes bacterium]|nr:protein-glutamate O-methyltransferase CheR [Planctomycetota bacterium]